MTDPVTARPTICLNMIVRNETHIVREVLDSVAPYITSWVIVDTGSDDGTQDLIREHMANLGIPGKLYERPWRNFGHNRTEALARAQGHGDYIWVMDADDTVVGTPDFSNLSADVYWVRRRVGGSAIYWRPELFRDGVRARWVGVTHEYAAWGSTATQAHLEGDYHIADRQLSSRNLAGEKFARDRDILLAELERTPDDARSVFYLAQSYRDLADYPNAREWYARRVELGGWDQEVFYAMYQLAAAMATLGEPWPAVQDAQLRAWEFRPTRAEPLHWLARRYREDRRWALGWLFARCAAEIACPKDDLFVQSDIYAWRATDEQAICASWLGEHTEAFGLCRSVLACADIPDDARARIAKNRDFSVPAVLAAALRYPQTLVESRVAGARDSDVTVSFIAGPNRADIEQTLNSFLNCCTDVSRVGRFLVANAGLSATDRTALAERYRFVEFVDTDPADGPEDRWEAIRGQIGGRYWLHVDGSWRFFAPEAYVTRLMAVLDVEPQVYQVGVNFDDAIILSGACAPEEAVRRAPGAGRYVLADAAAIGPAMYDTARLDQPAGLCTATLDEVLCLRGFELPQQPEPPRAAPTASAFQPGGYAPARELLIVALQRNPDDALLVLQLAQSYRDAGDAANALTWFSRRIELGGDNQEVFYAMYQCAECMARLTKPWPDVQDAYLRAWEFRRTRAEPLYALARHYRSGQRFWLAYLFAKAAAEIALPEKDRLVMGEVYRWRALEEQAGCAQLIGKTAEAFTLSRQLLARPGIPDGDRQRISKNRDALVPAVLDAASGYPDMVAASLRGRALDAQVTVSVVAGPDRGVVEQTLNSFLRCCTDISRVGRFLILDTGLPAEDRAALAERYRFAEFVDAEPADGHDAQLERIRADVGGRFWLHLGTGWRFFAPEAYITRLTAVLDAEPRVCAVGVNFADADLLTGACAPGSAVRRTPEGSRYVVTDTPPTGPVMFDTARLDQPDWMRAATLDEVLAIVTDRSLRQQRG